MITTNDYFTKFVKEFEMLHGHEHPQIKEAKINNFLLMKIAELQMQVDKLKKEYQKE